MNSALEFAKQFATERDCIDHLLSIRWRDGEYCPKCGSSEKIYHKSDGRFRCSECARVFTHKAGTIFEHSNLELRTWFYAIYLACNQKNGVSSHQLARDLGIAQKSAWFVVHRIHNEVHANNIDRMNQPTHNTAVKVDAPFDKTLEAFINASTSARKRPVSARPFVKWIGGKGAIAPLIAAHLPNKIPRYYELFVGGGALFYHLRERITSTVLADSNLELMTTYKVIQRDLPKLVHRLSQYQKAHSKENYYLTRDRRDLSDPIEIAARFIYLNKTCHNGLYSVNKRGRFNSPMGSCPNPTICDEQNLTACHIALKSVSILPYSFETIDIADNSIVYCDPPYDCNYNQHQVDQCSGAMQERLMHYASAWHKQGCKVIISNSDTELIRNLYSHKPFTIHEITAPRSVSCMNKSRRKTTELLIIAE